MIVFLLPTDLLKWRVRVKGDMTWFKGNMSRLKMNFDFINRVDNVNLPP